MQNTDSDYIIIPNPIYDVVFRYLMQDYDSALIILSTLINEKIKKLEFQPLTFPRKSTQEEYDEDAQRLFNKRFEIAKQKILADDSLSDFEKNMKIHEITIEDPMTGRDIKIFHLDFLALIEKENGEEEMVMIELQKVALETNIFRFKQYIAENFQKKRKTTEIDPDTGQKIEMEVTYRLIPIFILNFKIEDQISDLMIKTRQVKTGIFTGKILNKKNKFIDHLSYELYVVQLPYLQEIKAEDFEGDEYRTKLYALLKLFDQKSKKINNDYRLRLFRRIFPGYLDRVIKRLQMADINNPDLEKQMQAEDYFLKPLLQRDNKISWLLQYKEDTEKELKENRKEIEGKDRVIEESKKELEESKKELEESKLIIINLAKTLKQAGKSTAEIQQLTSLSQEEIEDL